MIEMQTAMRLSPLQWTVKAGRIGNAWIIALASALYLCGCGESDSIIRKKLDIILASDLDSIVSGLPKSNLADSVFVALVSYKTYREGMYSKMAIADFYFLKKVNVKITRKYRYFAAYGLWDRYFNEYMFIDDTTHTQRRR